VDIPVELIKSGDVFHVMGIEGISEFMQWIGGSVSCIFFN